MSEPGDPQVIIATPDQYQLVITVDHRGLVELHTSMASDLVVRFLRRYAEDVEHGRTANALGVVPIRDLDGNLHGSVPFDEVYRLDDG